MAGAAVGLTSSGGSKAPAAGGGRPQIDHAKLKIYEAKPTPTGAVLGASSGEIVFQFNPKELTIAKSAKWGSTPSRDAKKAAPPEFQGAEPSKLSLEMFFDATDAQDTGVTAVIEKLFQCCVPTDDSHGKKKALPPLVVFSWGTITSFPSVIKTVSAKYSLFSAQGTPIRATCTVTLEEMPGENGGQNPTSGSLATRRMHRVVTGDTLASLAFAKYGDPNMWRLLAEFNDIDDPLRLPSGSVLMVPSPEELLTPER